MPLALRADFAEVGRRLSPAPAGRLVRRAKGAGRGRAGRGLPLLSAQSARPVRLRVRLLQQLRGGIGIAVPAKGAAGVCAANALVFSGGGENCVRPALRRNSPIVRGDFAGSRGRPARAADADGVWHEIAFEQNNFQRLRRFAVQGMFTGVKLEVLDGETPKKIYGFDFR